MKVIRSFVFTVVLGATCFGAEAQSSREFKDQSAKYALDLLGEWRAVSYSDAVGRQRTEFVYRDRGEGLLRISKAADGRRIADLARDEEETLKVYKSGFEMAGKEAFGGGSLKGLRLSFYYLEGGRRIAATYYFLEDRDSVWMLKFTGKRGLLDTIRNVTDQMARSFRTL